MRAIRLLPQCVVASFIVSLAPADVGAVNAREFQLEDGGAIAPHVRLEFGSDSNPLRSTDGSAASSFFRVEPTLEYILRQRNNRLTVSYAGELVEYATSYCRSTPSASNGILEAGDCPQGASALNKASYQTHRFGANTFLEISRRLRVTGDFSIRNVDQPLGTGLTADEADLAAVFEPDSFRQTAARVGFSYGANRARGEIRANLSYLDRDFQEDAANPDRNLSDLSERRVQPDVALFYRIGTRTQAFGGVRIAQIRGGNAERDNETLFAGLEFDTSGITTGSISVNSVRQDYQDDREDLQFTGFDLAITWRPRTYSTVVLSGARQTERGVFNTSGVGISTTLSADWTHFWSDLFSTRVFVQSVDNDEADVAAANLGDGSSGDDSSVSARLEGNYNIRRWLDIGAFLESDSRSGVGNGGLPRDFERTVIGITLNGTI